MSIPFHNTGWGQQFFNAQLPRALNAFGSLVSAMERIATALEEQNKPKETPGGVKVMLDLSTNHAPEENPDWGDLRVVPHEYGWVVFVDNEAELPDWIKPAHHKAHSSGCMIINFDAAGDVLEDLPKWEW